MTTEIRDRIYQYIGGVVREEGGILLEIGGMPDYLHLVLKLRPIHHLPAIMQKIKGSSSKWLNSQQQLPEKFGWQSGYGAFTVSESQAQTVIQYVRQQEKHHQAFSFQDEFVQLLKHHQVDYDERYLWG